jgi:hypothetical protein
MGEEKSRERCTRDGVRGEEKGVQVGEGEGDQVKFRWEGGALRGGRSGALKEEWRTEYE